MILESAAPCTDSQGAAGILCMAETTYSRNLAAELQPQPAAMLMCEMAPCEMGRRDDTQGQGARFGTTAPTRTPEAGATTTINMVHGNCHGRRRHFFYMYPLRVYVDATTGFLITIWRA
eukprot:COSAG05_NODE_810_length_7182_cov_5.572780_1_plen_119_part_00